MWICHCHAVNDGTIKEFAKQPGATWKKLTAQLGVSTQCGICATEAKRIFDEAQGKTPRKRKKKAPAITGRTETSDLAETTAPSANVLSDRLTQPAQTSSQVFLACGKCTCTCGK